MPDGFRQGFVRVRGHQLFYRSRGKPEKGTLLIVHGGPDAGHILLLPFAADFRWLRERQDNPWYPTARLIRQHQFNDWGKAIDLLCRELVGMGRRWSDDGAHWNPQPAGRAGASH